MKTAAESISELLSQRTHLLRLSHFSTFSVREPHTNEVINLNEELKHQQMFLFSLVIVTEDNVEEFFTIN